NGKSQTDNNFLNLTNDQCPMTNDYFYCTGDLARWLPAGPPVGGDSGGVIEFLGRIDHQVKIRGYRIELGEIENCLLTHPGIKECVVIVKDDYLCAYVVSTEEIGAGQLRESVLKRLPEYMTPAYFVQIEKLPLNPNGKINTQALPQPEINNVNAFAAPENELQEKLVEIWAEVLALEKHQISIDMDFFKIGGHSLKAALMIAKIHKVLNVKIPFIQLFTKPIIRELAAYIKKMKKEKLDTIAPVEQKEYYRLSSAQKRMYFMQLLDPTGTTYNIPQVNIVNKKLDIELLTSIFKQIIQHHQSLRTSFEMIAEEPVQRIHEKIEFNIEYNEAKWETDFDSHLKNFLRPFNLNKAPLIRVKVIDSGLKYLLMIDMHHIINDGVSSMILLKDFNALFRNREAELPALRIQYKDYAEWQNSDRQKSKLKQQEQYWLEQFAGDIPVLDIPTDYPRPTLRSTAGDIVKWDIPEELTDPIRDLLKVTGCTLNIFFLAVHTVLLAKYSNQEEIVVGTVSAGRSHADLEQVVGMFVNMLAIRSKPCKNKTFKDFLLEIKKSSIDAYENQDYQFDDLVAKLGLQGNQARTPIFETVFIVQNLEMGRPIKNEYNGAENEITPVDIPMHLLNNQYYDLVFQANEGTNIINLKLMFATALFKPSTAQWMKIHFMDIIKQVIENPGIKLMDISITQQFIKAEPKINKNKQSDFRF
ncbi:MAG: condensation domain-containing protein, partial [Acidobacteria bacterium]|nr:condensation domain-containing protein [Acidobacteriota bacterium]